MDTKQIKEDTSKSVNSSNDFSIMSQGSGSGMSGIGSGISSIMNVVSNGINNIKRVNGDLYYDALEAMSNKDYGIGTTDELMAAYDTRPIAKTDFNFLDVGGKTWGGIIGGSFEDSFSGFNAGMSMGGNPYLTAALAIAGGASGLITGIVGRDKAETTARILSEKGRNIDTQSAAKLAWAAANSKDYLTDVVYKDGGMLNTHGIDWSNGVTYFNLGGSHQSNPLGGILQGFDSMGVPNMVEEGEVKYNDYIYSKENKLSKKYQEDSDLEEKYIGETFADIAKSLSKESEERPNDPISKRTLEDNMARLASAQDAYNLDKAKRKLKRGIDNLNQEDLMYLAEALNYTQQPLEGGPGVISDEEALQMLDAQLGNMFAGGGYIDWMEAAPVIGGGVAVLNDALGVTNRNDFSAFEPVKNALKSVRTVSASPIGGYLKDTSPVSVDYMANAMRNQYANNVYNIANLAGNNRGTAMAGILSNANNFRSSLGDLYLNDAKQSFENKMKLAEFNTGIREKEVANSLAAQQANLNRDIALVKGWQSYADALQRIKDANDEARGYNFSRFAELLGAYGKSLRAFEDRERQRETIGDPGSENSYYGARTSNKSKKEKPKKKKSNKELEENFEEIDS